MVLQAQAPIKAWLYLSFHGPYNTPAFPGPHTSSNMPSNSYRQLQISISPFPWLSHSSLSLLVTDSRFQDPYSTSMLLLDLTQVQYAWSQLKAATKFLLSVPLTLQRFPLLRVTATVIYKVPVIWFPGSPTTSPATSHSYRVRANRVPGP